MRLACGRHPATFRRIASLLLGCWCFISAVYAYGLPVVVSRHLPHPVPYEQQMRTRLGAFLTQNARHAGSVFFGVPSSPRKALLPCRLSAMPVSPTEAAEPSHNVRDSSEVNNGKLASESRRSTESLAAGNSNGTEQPRKDHKALGAMMDLFCFPKPRVGSIGGLGPALLPRGQALMLQLQDALRRLQSEQGFQEVRASSCVLHTAVNCDRCFCLTQPAV